MNTNKFLKLLFICLNIIVLVGSCPFYPKAIKINQDDPLLVSTYQYIEDYLDLNLKLNNISSFIFTIVYMDEIVWSKAYGNINPTDSSSPPLTLDSNFRIGSCTKLFTSLMMLQLRDKGLIRSLDDGVKEYFPQFKINDINNLDNTKKGVTFRQLASHTSGLPRETPCEPDYYGTINCTEDIILDNLSKQFLLSSEYKQVHYSNIGFSVLGRTLGEIYKKSNTSNILVPTIQHPQIYYEHYIENQIFSKLQMNSSSYDLDSLNSSNLAKSYYIDNSGNVKLVQNGLSGWNSPGGGIYSTARDMSKFIQFVLNGNQDILQESTRNEFLTSVSLLANGNQSFGIPFEMFYDNVTNIWFKGKNGLVFGYRSQITLATQLELGAFGISMINTGGDLFTREILQILIPVYESLIIKEIEKEKSQQINEQDLMVYKLIIGQYNNTFGEGFNIDYDDTLNLLIGYFDNTPTTFYSISNFTNDSKYSYIKRLNILDYNCSTCSSVVNGPNEELIYFNFIKNLNGVITACNGLNIMGYSLIKL